MATRRPLTAEELAACCAPVTGTVIDAATAERLAKTLKALGDPTRLRLMSIIAAMQDGEACIYQLTEPVGLSQATVSHHMKQLVESGLITREQRGRCGYYRVITGSLAALAAALTPSVIATPAG